MIFLFTALGFIFIGTFILSASLFQVRYLIEQLPSKELRKQWHYLTILIIFFIIGYLNYAATIWDSQMNLYNLIVPIIFFLGACFVWLVSSLSLQTAEDMQRLSFLEYENITDPLTELYNRRYLERQLQREIEIAQRYELPLSILLIDADHFKLINDNYGHQIGDLALCHLSKLIRTTIRHSDIAARYGGEEFLIIAPSTSSLVATALAEKLCQSIESHSLALPENFQEPREIQITVSIGVVSLGNQANNSKKLFIAADKALYQAKQEGRNRVVVSSLNTAKLQQVGGSN
ncbi:MAG: GGDEF domain-containing protein [Cyanobacteria bacterium P01_A01_bin.40]